MIADRFHVSAGPLRSTVFWRRRLAWLVLLAMLALLPGCGGCGGGGSNDPYAKWGGMSEEEWRKQRAEQEKAEEEEAKKAAAAAEEAKKKQEEEKKKEAEEASATAAAEQASSPAASQAAQQPTAQVAGQTAAAPGAVLPLNIADWKTEHYYLARAQGDPRLPEAIAQLGRQFVGNASAARLLVNLLGSDELGGVDAGSGEESGPRRAAANSADEAATVAAIAEALSINATDAARQAIGQMIGGELAGEVPSAGAAALQAVSRRPCAETDALLLDVLMRMSQSPKGELLSPDYLGSLLAALTPSGAESVRVEIAARMLGSSSSLEQRELLAPILLELRPENLAAQAMLYHDFNTPTAMKQTIEAHLTSFSSEVLRRLLGTPLAAERTPPRAGSASGSPLPADVLADPRLPTRVARHVWNESSVARLADQIYRLDSLDGQANRVLLASSIPSDLLRSRLLGALKRTWQEGPTALTAAALPTDASVEPGFVVVLKTVARRAPAGSGALLASGSVDRLRDRQAAAKQWETVAADWKTLGRDVLVSFCERLEETSEARAAQTGPSGRSAARVPGDFPVAIHDGARVVSSYALDWPRQAVIDGQSLPVSPTQVRHVRIEETNRLLKLMGHYRHRLESVREHAAGDVVWLSGLESVDEGQVRSVDVLLRRGKGAPAAGADLDEKLTIDVLAITIKDPAAGSP